MDEASQKEFDRLVKLDPESLTSNERDFLRARRSYLNKEQKRVFESIVSESKEETNSEVSVEEPVVEKRKPGRPPKA